MGRNKTASQIMFADAKKFFTKESIIKCEMFHSALSMNMVKEFLTKRVKNYEDNILQ